MREGEIVKFVPCISTARQREVIDVRLQLLLDALTERVYIICFENVTGNAKVRDSKGIVFYCNRLDLSRILS